MRRRKGAAWIQVNLSEVWLAVWPVWKEPFQVFRQAGECSAVLVLYLALLFFPIDQESAYLFY